MTAPFGIVADKPGETREARSPPYDVFLAGSLAMFGLIGFLDSGNFLFVLGGALAAGVVFAGSRLLLPREESGVRVRCRECQALNAEDAKFCSQCGRAV